MMVCLSVITGCTSDDPPVTDVDEQTDGVTAEPSAQPTSEPEAIPSATPTETADGEEVVKEFFQAFATGQPRKMRRMLKLASPGSPAEAYARVQHAVAEVRTSQGTAEESAFEVTPKGIRLCSFGEVRECTHFVDITVDDGQVVSWANNKEPLAPRTVGTTAMGSALQTRFTVVGAFFSVQSDALIIAVDAHNRGEDTVDVAVESAEYVAKNGRQASASGADGPDEVRPGARAAYILSFAGVRPGGTLYIPVNSADFSREDEVSAELSPLGQ